MKLENQVCNLDQAKKLKELGIAGRPMLMHCIALDGSTIVNTDTGVHLMCEHYPAFTVAELGVMLPNGYDTIRLTGDDWKANEWHGFDLDDNDCPNGFGYLTEAEARAAMLIYLLENNHVSATEVNERLKAA